MITGNEAMNWDLPASPYGNNSSLTQKTTVVTPTWGGYVATLVPSCGFPAIGTSSFPFLAAVRPLVQRMPFYSYTTGASRVSEVLNLVHDCQDCIVALQLLVAECAPVVPGPKGIGYDSFSALFAFSLLICGPSSVGSIAYILCQGREFKSTRHLNSCGDVTLSDFLIV